ncbi:HAD family hydrolase [Alicyclobacillus sp. SO9]|uniref:HAD family hydrolase n=1 Tax=Alicyclobacillus sp. SO9 TaxID=2665646 RepID=UPI0018E89A25|nr:HAD family hydrolase [Alicyclobacillus sp. SO9]QQE77781.1 HAD family hydrolase [Alicyclobacillus sp. SO9]
MGRYSCVFFDLDHTLIDTLGQYHKGLAIALHQLYGNQVSSDEFERHFMNHHDKLWARYDKREITMTELRRNRFLLAWKELGVERTIEEADKFHSTYDATFENTLEPFPGTLELMDTLAGEYRLGAITNGSPDLQWRKVCITGLNKYFREEDIIISERVGKAKPHPSVYEAACRAFRVDKENAVMIGDNFLSDVQGAREFGMDALWYVPDDDILLKQEQYVERETPLRTAPEVQEAIRGLEHDHEH